MKHSFTTVRFGEGQKSPSCLLLASYLPLTCPLHLLRKVLILCTLLFALGGLNAWGADPSWSHTFTTAPGINNNSFTVNNAEWTVSTVVGADKNSNISISLGNDNSVKCWKFGTGKNTYYSNISLSTDYFTNYNVKSVEIIGCGNVNNNINVTVTQGSGANIVTIGSSTISYANSSSWHTNTNCKKTINSNKGNGGVLTINISPTTCAFCLRQIVVTYEDTPPTTCATPTISLAEGTYTGTRSVTLGCSTTDATIRYTTDGSSPTSTSTVYSSAISVEQTTTIKAKAFKDGLTASDEASATYTIKCATPTFTKNAGTYYNDFTVELATNFGTSIYYTTDNTTPTTSSTLYDGAITVNATQTIKAIAVKANCENSAVASADYTLKCATPTFSATGTYAQSVEISGTTTNAVIRYTLDGSDPTETSDVYSTAINIPVTKTLKARAFKTGYTKSDAKQTTYTIKCAQPTATAAGTYTGPQYISLATEYGDEIYYTTSTTSAAAASPSTSGTLYTGPFQITATTKIKAIAKKEGCDNSNILGGSSTYQFTIQYNVRWHDNEGQITEALVNSGSTSYTCPTDPSPSERGNCGDRFMGWTNEPYTGNGAPAVLFTNSSGTKPAIIGDTDFYAVFADYVEK